MNKKFWVRLLLVVLNFIAGLAGNLIAGWIQADVWSNLFTLPRIVATIIFAVLVFILITTSENVQSLLEDEHNESQASVQNDGIFTHIQAKSKREHALDGLLKNVKFTLIDEYLGKVLGDSIFLDLNFTNLPSAVSRKIRNYVPQNDKGETEALSSALSIYKVFEKGGRNLLILGEPGSGKTFILLHLAKELIQKAVEVKDAPVPVYFSLSSWSGKKTSVADWIVEEMLQQYQIARQQSWIWLRSKKIILLLDGLDEVFPEHRDECVRAINTFKSKHQIDVVVCCRKTDYENLRERLNLTSAICILPLPEKEVRRFFNQRKLQLQSVGGLVQNETILQDVRTSPFMLNVISSVYQGVDKDNLDLIEFSMADWDRLAGEYTRINLDVLSKKKGIENNKAEQFIKWLSNLAKNMKREGLSSFYVNQIEPTWISNELVYLVFVGFIAGITMGVLEGLILGLSIIISTGDFWWGTSIGFAAGLMAIISNSVSGAASGLVGGKIKIKFMRLLVTVVVFLLVEYIFNSTIGDSISRMIGKVLFPDAPGGLTAVGLSGGVVAALMMVLVLGSVFWRREIQQVEVLTLAKPNLQQFKKSLLNGLRGGSVFGLVVALNNMYIYKDSIPSGLSGAIYIVFNVVAAILLYILLGVGLGVILSFLQPSRYRKQLLPNQGIRNLYINAIRLAILGGIVFGAFGWWQDRQLDPSGMIGMFTMSGVELGFSGAFFLYGGGEIIKHYTLRLLLKIQGLLPWRLVLFLDTMASAALVRRVGGSYSFIHPLFLQYFASLNDSKIKDILNSKRANTMSNKLGRGLNA